MPEVITVARNEKAYVEQNDILNLVRNLGNEEFLIASESRTDLESGTGFEYWTALIPGDLVPQALKTDSFDLQMDEGRPGFNGSDPGTTVYERFNQFDGVEPLVFRRRFANIKPGYVEVSEEFRHFHNLYEDKLTGSFIKIMGDGSEHEIVTIRDKVVRIRVKELRQFLAAKQMYLALYVYSLRCSPAELAELGLAPVHETVQEDLLTFYRQRQSYGADGFRSSSLIRAKKLIPPFDRSKCGIWPFPEQEQKESVKFIVASQQGQDIEAPCDSFVEIPGECLPGRTQYLTPVFFRKEVLNKYRERPDKYKIRDGYFCCGSQWGMSIDNNRDDGYIAAYLGDLGRDLPTSEQIHWRQYNVPPKGGISMTAFARDFNCQFAPPAALDHLFLWRLDELRKRWHKATGWHLFKPLSDEDEHHLESLHIPSNSKPEFEQQVLSLSMALTESINEKSLSQFIDLGPEDRSITKLGKFLAALRLNAFECHISFLRNLRDLRAGCGAHRKGDAYQKAAKAFGLDSKPLDLVFKEILTASVELLDCLEKAADLIIEQGLPLTSTAQDAKTMVSEVQRTPLSGQD
jgi:hypothetical protein